MKEQLKELFKSGEVSIEIQKESFYWNTSYLVVNVKIDDEVVCTDRVELSDKIKSEIYAK